MKRVISIGYIKYDRENALKTKDRQRLISLTKEALSACKRIKDANNDRIVAFSSYCSKTGCKANSSSGGLDKWLRQYLLFERLGE